MTEQQKHCIDQVIRFSKMLRDTASDSPSTHILGDTGRNRDAVIAQLAFNWGRYVELAAADGRKEWQFLEANLTEGKYDEIIDHAGKKPI